MFGHFGMGIAMKYGFGRYLRKVAIVIPAPVYRQRDPQSTPYYQCIEDHFETFEQIYEDRFERQYGFYRPYVREVICRYLDCGILHNGFARVRYENCCHEN